LSRSSDTSGRVMALSVDRVCRRARGARYFWAESLARSTDSQGAAVAGAKISIANEDTELTRSTTTDANGYYVASDLPVGLYSVSAEQAGFKLVKSTGNDLVAGAV